MSKPLIKSAMGTLVLKIINAGLLFVVNIMLARLLGVEGFGVYTYVIAWIWVLGVVAIFGLDKLLVREVSAYQTQSAWGLMRGILCFADLMILLISFGLMMLAYVVTEFVIKDSNSSILSVFWVAMILLPLLALTRLRQSAMQGLQRVVIGQLPEMLIKPLLFIIIIGTIFFIFKYRLDPLKVIKLDVLSTCITFLIGILLLNKIMPTAAKNTTTVYKTRTWISSAIPLLFVAGGQVIMSQTDIVMLGAMKNAEAAGVYFAASRLALLIVFVLMSANTALAPTISRLYLIQDIDHLQHIVKKAAKVTLIISLIMWVILIFCGRWFLSIFGEEFIRGYLATLILSSGLVLCSAAISVGLLLSMTAYEKDLAIITCFVTILNIILNGVLIPNYSIEGAAVATSISILILNALAFFTVRKKLGINPSIFGKT